MFIKKFPPVGYIFPIAETISQNHITDIKTLLLSILAASFVSLSFRLSPTKNGVSSAQIP
jgi:hypothetical protein